MGSLSKAPSRKDLLMMRELIETGKVIPVIDKCYPISEAVEALRYVDTGHAQGKVIITMNHS